MIKGFCKNCKKNFRKRTKSYKFCSVICANRFNLNNKHNVKLPRYSKNLAEFIGICLGDGYASLYQIEITLNSIADKEYIPYVTNLAISLFPEASVSSTKRNNENAVSVRINSRTVADFLRKMGVVSNAKYIPNWILENSSYRRRCIRGLFDTEGSISFKIYAGKIKVGLYKQLNFRNSNMILMAFVRDTLLSFGFKPTRTMRKSLYLSNHESIADFEKQIGFSNPKLKERSRIIMIEDYRKWKLQNL